MEKGAFNPTSMTGDAVHEVARRRRGHPPHADDRSRLPGRQQVSRSPSGATCSHRPRGRRARRRAPVIDVTRWRLHGARREFRRRPTRTGVATNMVDAVVALVLLIIGIVVIVESRRLGAGWTSDGPGAGYFPFYIGLIIVHLRRRHPLPGAARQEARHRGLRRPRAARSACCRCWCRRPSTCWPIAFLGLYVASAIYIALFMIVLGKYSWVKSVDRRAGRQHRSSSSCSRSGSRCRCTRARSIPCASSATESHGADAKWMNSAP